MKHLLSWIRKQDFSYLYALLGESTLGLMFLLYVLIARVVGPEQYGVFSAAVALGGILGVMIQFGLPMLLARNVAADPTEGTKQTIQYLLTQILNTIPIVIILPVITHVMGFEREGMILCYLMIVAELFRSIKMSWRSVIKGKGWFHKESVSVFLERSFTVLLASVILFTTKNLLLTAAAIVTARLIDNIATGTYLAHRFPLTQPHTNISWRETYRKAFPFALHGLLWIIYYQIDIIMLKGLTTEAQVGFYGAAYRVMEIFAALPRVVFFVAFTRFAQCHADAQHEIPKQMIKALRMLFLMILPCLVIAGFAQPFVFPLLFGPAFAVSVGLLAVLLPGLALNMFNTVNETYLLTTGREIKLTPLLLTTSAANVVMNLILIPRMGALGAAIATVGSEVILCALGMVQMVNTPVRSVTQRIIYLIPACVLIAVIPSLYWVGFPLLASLGLLILFSAILLIQMRYLWKIFV